MRKNESNRSTVLTDDAAEKMLANVFEACGLEPSAIPLEKLVSYCEYRREKYSLQKTVLAIILAVFLLLPLCFLSPKYTVTKTSPDDALIPTYEVNVAGLFPIDFVSADVNGQSIAVYETGNGVFKVSPAYNGTLRLRVQLVNRQWVDKTVEISGVDIDSPEYLGTKRAGDVLYIFVADNGSGIDLANSYMLDGSDHRTPATSYDETTGAMTFPFPEGDTNIYVSDLKSNVLHMVFSY